MPAAPAGGRGKGREGADVDYAQRLQASGIRASVRAGAVRVSFHLHNTDADVDAVARALGR